MTFTRPFFLILLVVLGYFAALGWPRGRYGRGRAWAGLVLRCLAVLLIVFSLAGLQSIHGGDELAVVFLVDVSDSVPQAEKERALLFVEEALAAMEPMDRAALILFGADALVERPMMGTGELGEIASVPLTHQTDLEGAVRLGTALFPAGAARRMVILSDGRPTLGEPERAVRLAHAQGVQFGVVPLQAGLATEAWLAEVEAPDRLHSGEEFTVLVTAHATADTGATLTVLAGDVVVVHEQVHLGPGANTFAVPLTGGDPGFSPLRAYITPESDTYPQNNGLSAFALVEGPPRVLVVAGEEAGEHLPAALQAAGLEVDQVSPGSLTSDVTLLGEYAAVVLVDTPAQAYSPRALDALQTFVRDLGGGLVAVGGPHAYGVGGWYATPLEESLPVDMTIHDAERFPPMAIVIVIDKSGSMAVEEGGVQKIRLAGEAAARVAELITDLDEITVIAFDDRPVDIIGPLLGSQRDEVIDRVILLQAGGGGIYVRESLRVALDRMTRSDHTVKHVILLADGSDAEHQSGVPKMVEDEFAGRGITLSTVAIGAGPDLAFLQAIAALGNGRYHFTDKAATLPVIFAEETQLAMRSYVVEEPFYPQQRSVSPILAGVEAVPQLAGYVATTAKPAGRVILTSEQGDPLLASWQYGLGRAVAWTSDATGRWAQRWVAWEGFSRFWAQAVRWTIVERADVPVEMAVTLAGEEAWVTVDALDEGGAFVNGLEAAVSVVGPGGEPQLVDLTQTGPGRYEGVFAPQAEGAHLLRLTGALEGQDAIALTSGWVMGYSPEYAALGGDPEALASLAGIGGGGVLEEPADAFAHNLRGAGTREDLWSLLLALAALLLPLDVGVRRLALGRQDLGKARAWLAARLSRRPSPVDEAPSPVGRLFEAKARVGEQMASPEPVSPVSAPPVAAPPAASPATPAERPEVGREPAEPPRPQAEEAADEGTLAGRLLKKRRGREE